MGKYSNSYLLIAHSFPPRRDKPYSMLKPGQHKLTRDYYKEATTEKPEGEKVLGNYERFKTIYENTQVHNVKVGDYKVPAKSMNTMTGYELTHKPTLFNHTALGRTQKAGMKTPSSSLTLTSAGDTVSKNIGATAHWKSSYKEIVKQVDGAEWNKSSRPTWSINRVAYSSGRACYETEFGESMGKHGHNPRALLGPASLRQENKKDQLSVGTTKTTSHIPGYNGFIP